MKMLRLFTTTVGKKFLVAITGLFMIFFLIAHLAGNLEIFSGPDAVNHYAQFLRTMPKVLWSFRILLIIAVIVHVALTINLAKRNTDARLTTYAKKKSRKASLISRTMMLSGLTVLTFVLYHLAHYTFGIADPSLMELTTKDGHHHVYNMMVMGFSHPLVASFYILAQVLLAGHLAHGFSSAARTLGLSDRRWFTTFRNCGVVFATVIAALYISIPLSVLLGFIPLDR